MQLNWLHTGTPLTSHLQHESRNNFTLIRLIAALMVVKQHAFSLTAPNPDACPSCDFHLRTLGLPAFFFISGLLVSQSLEKSSSWKNFAWKRLLRLYPAACFSILFCALLLGPLLTTWPLKDYFASALFYQYLSGCILFWIKYRLPGVFEHSLMGSSSVNSSLWTICLELKLYVGLLACWLIRLRHKKTLLVAVTLASLACGQFFPFETDRLLTQLFHRQTDAFGYLNYGPMFLAGVCCYVFRDQIVIRRWWVLVLLILFWLIYEKNFLVLTFLLVPCLCLFVASTGISFLKKVTPTADLSYGIYVFAYPVQQVVANYLRPQGTWAFFFLALVFVLPLALISWFFVEKKALALKRLVR